MSFARLVPLVLLASLVAAPVCRAATILHLSVSAAVAVTPDELDATLTAHGSGATPVVAQSAVNRAMASASAAVRKVSGVTQSTGEYRTWQVTEPDAEWRASETLSLVSKDGPALLALVGALQEKGLTVASLSWRLAPATEAAAHEKAEAAAIAKLRARVVTAADELGLKFSKFREVWLNPAAPVRPMLMAARAMPEPVAVAAPTTVRATVTADAELRAPAVH